MSSHAAVLAADASSTQSFILPAFLILLLVGLFLMNSRSRKKMAAKQASMRSSLEVGTRVQMISGLKGNVAFVDGEDVGIEIDNGVVATFSARAVAEVLTATDPQTTSVAPDDAADLVDEPPADGQPTKP